MTEFRTTRRRFLGMSAAGAAAVLAPGARALAKTATSGPADTVFLGGSVITMDGRRRIAKAMAVSYGRIVYVGGVAGARDWIGARTEVVDLAGGAVMPGIHDGHVHPLYAGRLLQQCSLGYLPLTVDEMRAMIQTCLDDTVDQEPDGWLPVADWDLQSMTPSGLPIVKEILDVLQTQRPIIVRSTDGHNALVNSRALQIAGVTASTPDPIDGTIVRDGQGNPTGHLIDGAIGLVEQYVPEPTFDQDVASMRTALGVMAARGVTTLNDAITWDYHCSIYEALRSAGELTARVHCDLVLDREPADDMASAIAYFDDVRATYDRRNLTVRTVKIFEDGVMEYPIQTAGLLKPYRVKENGQWVPGPSRGPIYFERPVLKHAVTELDAAGYRVHIHAIGDRAVRVALDGYQAALEANGDSDKRHTIAHLQLVDPTDLPRFAELGVLPCMQLQWAERDAYTMEALKRYLGQERWSRIYPSGSLAAAGALVTGGSDWPVDPSGPFDAIQQAVTRQGPFGGKYEPPLNPDQGVPLMDALAMHTNGTAFQLHQEGKTGSIEVGKAADVIVLDQDPTAVPIDQVRFTQVQRTFMGGESVFEAGAASKSVERVLKADKAAATAGVRRRGLASHGGCC
ncbi:MAG TPA: amidohydrolase [Actinomycetota bacterium]|nr:amidohydrolase [Actinomycetota bacterium]